MFLFEKSMLDFAKEKKHDGLGEDLFFLNHHIAIHINLADLVRQHINLCTKRKNVPIHFL